MRHRSHLLLSVSCNKMCYWRNVEGARVQLPGDTRYVLTSPEVISSLVGYQPKRDLNTSELNSSENREEWRWKKEEDGNDMGTKSRREEENIQRERSRCWEDGVASQSTTGQTVMCEEETVVVVWERLTYIYTHFIITMTAHLSCSFQKMSMQLKSHK